ncbi:MAG TPA: DUF1684 domain-containing protein [Flavobacteriia bacterium]|nr:DUF1684 domain-containing protein [Flavobacteriia bacterium]
MKNLLLYLFISFFTLSTIANLAAQQADDNIDKANTYKQQIEDYRKQKDRDYLVPEKTMLTAELMKDFKGLKYFPVNSKYKISAKLTRLKDLPAIKIKTSTGKVSNYVIYGKLSFHIDNKPYELSVYQSARLADEKRKESALFIPFTDKTSGKETYGGGRYLVLDNPKGDLLIIDFNMAYNPYCVYNPNHSCPIPPAENDLPVKILAGELMY